MNLLILYTLSLRQQCNNIILITLGAQKQANLEYPSDSFYEMSVKSAVYIYMNVGDAKITIFMSWNTSEIM